MSTCNKAFGAKVKLFRKRKKISQDELGKFLGLHQTAICRIESGVQRLSEAEFYKLSKYLNVKMEEFFK